MAPVAVVILNWNGEKLLRQFLPLVLANTDPHLAEVIVVDNGSSDGSLELLHNEFPQLRVIAFAENYGFAGGYNRALASIHNEYCVLLNSDVEPAPGWISPMLQYMKSHNDVGACQPKVLCYADRGRFEYAGACGGYIDRNGYPYCRGRIFDTCEVDEGQYDSIEPVFWATGAALMVRTKLYERCGGLDENFFAHMEEIDLCWRMQLLGYKIMVIPNSIVYHVGGASLSTGNPRKTYLNFRNNLLMLHKNLPDGTRKRRLLVRRLLDGIAWAKMMLCGDIANAKAVLKAHRDFKKMRKEYSEHPQQDLLRQGKHPNIIVDYYLKGHKLFSQIKH